MKLFFWRHRDEKQKLAEIERDAASVHSENITRLRENRETINKLKEALDQNNIIFQLAHVTGGHKK